MNDRLSAYIAGFGSAGIVIVGAHLLGAVTAGLVLTLFSVFGVAAIAIGVLDWWFDRGRDG